MDGGKGNGMGKREYEIEPGSQYDRNGAVVWCCDLATHYGSDGRYIAGHLPRLSDLEAVDAAVLEVVATRQPTVLVLGEDEVEATDCSTCSPLCSRCGTVCCGDCES